MDTTDYAHKAADNISSKANDVADKASKSANRVSDNLSDKAEELKETQEKVFNECRGFVKENPMTSLAIAAGVGFILSKITR